MDLNLQWQFRRELPTPYVFYDRVIDLPGDRQFGGSAALYGGRGERSLLFAANGVEYEGRWPDCGVIYKNKEGGPDSGTVLHMVPRFEPEWGWVLYAYMFAGDNNPHSEWYALTGVGGV